MSKNDLERAREELELETFELGREKLQIVSILPDPARAQYDIEIPVLSPVLARKKSLQQEIESLDVASLDCPVLPFKEGDTAAQVFRYEGYDFLTLQKLVERDYVIPEPQTAEEVIGYYARRIAQEVKLPSQFAVLVPKVREFLETKAFGQRVNLNDPALIKAISSNVAHYVTVKNLCECAAPARDRRAGAAAAECCRTQALRDAAISLFAPCAERSQDSVQSCALRQRVRA